MAEEKTTKSGPEISDTTKEKMTELQNSVKPVASLKKDSAELETPGTVSVLGQIYDLMVKKRELELQRRKQSKELAESELKEEDEFAQDVIKNEQDKKKGKKEKAKKKPKKKTSIFDFISGAVKLAGVGAAEKILYDEEKQKEKEFKPEAPKGEETKLKPETPKVEAPKAEAPKLKPETPKVEAPKAEEVPRTFTPTPTPSVQKVPTTPAPSTPPTAEKIGNLSKKFESGGKGPGVVGYDSVGGTSYGVYQIASKVGAMDGFLSFMDKEKPEWSKRLRAAGPSNTGSTKGEFPNVWRAIASEDPKGFEETQHKYIEKRSYEPAAQGLKKLNYDIDKQPSIMKDVLWSTAVQHGPGGAISIFKQAIQESGGPSVPPDILTKKVYEIRRTKFGSSTKEVRAGVMKRFDTESGIVLASLASPSSTSGTQLASASESNKDMKDQAKRDNATQISKTQTTNVNNQTQVAQNKPKYDDRPIPIAMAQVI